MGAGEDDEATRQEYAVVWNNGNQGQIVADRYDWSEAADKLPTTLEILYSMEDYWVLKAVMQVIARTNTDEEFGLAELPHQAAIRQIHFIDIGGSGGEVENDVSDIFVPVGAATEGVGEEGAALESHEAREIELGPERRIRASAPLPGAVARATMWSSSEVLNGFRE